MNDHRVDEMLTFVVDAIRGWRLKRNIALLRTATQDSERVQCSVGR